ncbi:MAG: hypothetical protein HQ519_19575 [Planctomycetes bacterium]|nr:hypothetical protein [Planctomycetota bacterium]
MESINSNLKQQNFGQLVEDLQIAINEYVVQNPVLFEAIAEARGGIEPQSLPLIPGYRKLLSQLKRTAQGILGPEVNASMASSVSGREILDAVTGCYLATRLEKADFELTRLGDAGDVYEVEWPKLSGFDIALSATFSAKFNERNQLAAIKLLSVNPASMLGRD